MSLNLDEIRDRALPMRDGFYHVVGYYRAFRREDFDALAAEVERLRGERDHYRRAMEYADAEAERLREENRKLRDVLEWVNTQCPGKCAGVCDAALRGEEEK